MSGLLRHKDKIRRLSPSLLKTAQDDLAVFLMQRLMGERSSVGPAAHRGTAAEAGIVMGLMNPDATVAECQEHAVAEFDRLAGLLTDDKQRDGVVGMVARGLEELRPYGIPTHTQLEINWQHPEIPLPFVGYVDLYWEDKGVLTDIKTTMALPSKINSAHARQVALYGAAISDNLDLRVTYVTPKKATTYAVEDARQHVEALVNIAKWLDRFLDLSDDPVELCRLAMPETESYYFSDPRFRQRAYEIFGV